MTQKTAKRDNASKPPVDKVLLFQRGLEMLAAHMAAGENKYPNDEESGLPNWMLGGKDDSEYLGAATRHLMKLRQGEFYDKEMGTPHGAAVVWNILAMLTLNYADQPLTAGEPQVPLAQIVEGAIPLNSTSEPQQEYCQLGVSMLLNQMVDTTKSILRGRNITPTSIAADMNKKFPSLLKDGLSPVYSEVELVELISLATQATNEVLRNYITPATAKEITTEMAEQMSAFVSPRRLIAQRKTAMDVNFTGTQSPGVGIVERHNKQVQPARQIEQPTSDPFYGDGNESTL